MTQALIGKVIDNYRIIDKLGDGGMGVVYLALHTKLETERALKIISPGLSTNSNFIKRFEKEAKVLARLNDPNIVQIYDYRYYDDRYFIVMEFIDGFTLSEKIKKDGFYSWTEGIQVFKQVLSAFEHAHNANIIHRDIKPNNIMINQNGIIKIMDFGLAKDKMAPSVTNTIASGGTLYYMPPEHVKGIQDADFRSDIYSLGMTFYELIAGKVPFERTELDFDIREKIIRKQLKPPVEINPDIPEALNDFIMKAIEKAPYDRFQTIKEMMENLLSVEKSIEDKIEETDYASIIISETSIAAQVEEKHDAPIGEEIIIDDNLEEIDKIDEEASLIEIDSDESTPPEKKKYPIILVSLLIITIFTFFLVRMFSGDKEITLPAKEKAMVAKFGQKDEKKIIKPEQDNKKTQIRSEIPATKPKKTGISSGLVKDTRLSSNKEKPKKKINSKKTEIKKKIAPVISVGRIQIGTKPAGAELKLDGKEVMSKRTPLLLDKLIPGKHKIEISKEGFHTVTKEINVIAGKLEKLDVSLIHLKGTLILRAIPWASIYIDGKLQKKSTDLSFSKELNSGNYRVKFVHPSLGTWEKQIKVIPGKENELLINFNNEVPRKFTSFDSDGKPVWAHIYMDGKKLNATTPTELKVRVGFHRFDVKRNGYRTDGGEKRILMEANFNETITFALKKIE